MKHSTTRGPVTRHAVVTGWSLAMYAGSNKDDSGRAANLYLVIKGGLSEPLNGVLEFHLQLVAESRQETGSPELPFIGVVLNKTPHINAMVGITPAEFQAILALATTGHLREFSINFDQRSTAKITSMAILGGAKLGLIAEGTAATSQSCSSS